MKKADHLLIFIIAFILTSCFDESTTITKVNIVDFDLEKSKNSILIDVRTPKEFVEGHLPNAINIDVKEGDFIKKISDLNKKQAIYVYCKSGMRSTKATKIMDTLGFKKIYNLDGGFLAWHAAGNLIEK